MIELPVSVIIPTYNSAHFLPECIDSINIGVPPVQIIVVDDCSTDDSQITIDSLSKKYSNIVSVRCDLNRGAAEARRIGILHSTQKYVSFIDADDFISSNALKSAYMKLKKTQADICIWELWRFNSHSTWKHKANPPILPISGYSALLMTLGEYRIHSLGVAKKSLYLKAYQEPIVSTINSDEIISRLVFAQAELVCGCNSKYFYRDNPVSTTRKLNQERLSSLYTHLWLLQFSKQLTNPPMDKIIRAAVGESWYYWTMRSKIGANATIIALAAFFEQYERDPQFRVSIIRNPKHLFAYIVIKLHLLLCRLSPQVVS